MFVKTLLLAVALLGEYELTTCLAWMFQHTMHRRIALAML